MLKDFKEYYKTIERQYFEMLANAKELDEAFKGGFLPEENYQQSLKMIEKIKDNYDRLSYVMLLINKPRKKKNQKQFEKLNKEGLQYCKDNKADMNSIIDGSFDALKDFKKYVKDVVKEKKDGKK